jgi:hypothetical protein
MRRTLGFVALLGGLAVALAYQRAPVLTIGASDLLSGWTYRGFYGAEGETRWSGAEAGILLPDPGPGGVRIELSASGWRPRRVSPPLLRVELRGAGVDARLPHEVQTLSFHGALGGLWDSSAVVHLRSETFEPGPQDPRELGVTVSGLTIAPLSSFPRWPPLREVVLGALGALLLAGLLLRSGVPSSWLLVACPGLVGLAFLAARPYAVLLSLPVLLVLGAAHAVAALAPGPTRRVVAVLGRAATVPVAGVRMLGGGWILLLLGIGALGVCAAYRAQGEIDIDLGSQREAAVARGFGAFEGREGVTFREPGAGATLDLRDFGSGDVWQVRVRASRAGGEGPYEVRWSDGSARLQAGEAWTESGFAAPPTGTWRSGLELAFPSAAGLRIDRVHVSRGRSLPSLRILVLSLVASLLSGVIGAGVSLSPALGRWALGFTAAAEALLLYRNPLLAVPFVPVFVTILLLTLAWGALLSALRPPGLPVPALVSACAGFAGWVTSTASPLYRGGHFVFHSSIAEEIWKGRFLIYYLPFPGSMLSRQAQWGDIVVPHPCLYHTLVAPLAAFPHPLFYFSEKCVLAALLSALPLLAGGLAARSGGPGAGAYAAAVGATLVPTFQLLGLGHLMTILGVVAMAGAMTVLVTGFSSLGERGLGVLVAALTACFLSYTAALLFAGCVVVWSLPFLARAYPRQSLALVKALFLAGLLALVLYYGNWAWPFLKESVPRIVSGRAGAQPHHVALLARLGLLPGKLDYSYGTLLVPLLGLGGLLLVPRGPDRVFLLSWGAVLVVFSGVDLYFNLLLKHHYFTQTPVAVGLGLLLGRLSARGEAGRVLAGAGILACAALGFWTARAVALGLIP